MVLSILHRATGVAMTFGLVILTAWLAAAAAGSDVYDQFAGLLSTLVGQVLLIGWSFSFFFHLANGLRHLVWDTGRGFEKQQTNASAWLAIIGALLLTAAYWVVLL